MSDLHDILHQHVDRGTAPGAVALVARGDDVEVVTVGSLDAEGSAPMARDSIFRIASITKPITAAAVLMLVEEGLLGLDSPVQEWLPELAKPIGGAHPVQPRSRTWSRPSARSPSRTCSAPAPAGASPPTSRSPRCSRCFAVQQGRPLPAGLAGPGHLAGPARAGADAVPAGRGLAVRHLVRSAGHPGRPRVGPFASGLPRGADLRTAGHEGHGVRGPGVEAAPLHLGLQPGPGRHPGAGGHPGRRVEPCPPLPLGRRAAWPPRPTTGSPSPACC